MPIDETRANIQLVPPQITAPQSNANESPQITTPQSNANDSITTDQELSQGNLKMKQILLESSNGLEDIYFKADAQITKEKTADSNLSKQLEKWNAKRSELANFDNSQRYSESDLELIAVMNI